MTNFIFKVVTVEQSETWINVDDILKFIPHSDSNQVIYQGSQGIRRYPIIRCTSSMTKHKINTSED